jgi:DHA2 family multidrug resistance protein
MLNSVTAGMMSKGADAFTAKQQALRIIDGLIGRQAAVLAYNHVFVLVSSLFFIGFPLVFLLRRGTPSGEVEIAAD